MSGNVNVNADMRYLDLQGLAGITKHTGGFPATEELLSMCHIENASEALGVGCAIGDPQLLFELPAASIEGATFARTFRIQASKAELGISGIVGYTGVLTPPEPLKTLWGC